MGNGMHNSALTANISALSSFAKASLAFSRAKSVCINHEVSYRRQTEHHEHSLPPYPDLHDVNPCVDL